MKGSWIRNGRYALRGRGRRAHVHPGLTIRRRPRNQAMAAGYGPPPPRAGQEPERAANGSRSTSGPVRSEDQGGL